MPKLTRIAPELPVSNLREAVEYYERQLGFQIAMEMPGGDYAIVERDGIAIHLFEDDAGSHSPGGVHIFTADLDELHAELLQRGARMSQGIERKPWGNRDFRVKDTSGNEIKFTEPLGEAAWIRITTRPATALCCRLSSWLRGRLMLPENRIPAHPGEILQEQFLEPLRLTQVALAEHIGVPVQRINEIVRGKRGVTPETAWFFSQAFDTTPEFWINLQTNHDLALNRPERAVSRLRKAG